MSKEWPLYEVEPEEAKGRRVGCLYVGQGKRKRSGTT